MNTEEHQLPDELAWQDDGHASDLVITALADGERDLVPLDAFTHVHSCRQCGERLGAAALLAAEVDEALRYAPAAELADASNGAVISAPRRLPLPVPALAAALVLAGVGAAPSLVDLPTRLPQWLAALTSNLPILLRTAWLLVRSTLASGGPAVTVAWLVAALVLLATGVLVARLMPLSAQAKGEMR